MAVTPARRIAFEVLRRVEAEGAYAADLLHARLGERTKPADAALATELVLGALRWQRLLDFLLERYLERPPASLDLEVRIALRLGLYQLRWLTRIPARAAVSESVELTRLARKSSAAALVNAVLRRAASQAAEPPERLLPASLPLAERLGILHSHPTWMAERWLARFGEQRAMALLEANNRPPRPTCVLHEPARREEVIRALEEAGLTVAPGRWLKAALAVSGGNATATSAYRRGAISIQDEASQMVALLVNAQSGDSVLDLCAAPGGKTATLARAAGPGALVVAADLHPHRLRAMGAQLARLNLGFVHRVALDATGALSFSRNFHRILVDAPCSGTGTLARNPEIRWRLRPEDLADLHRRQTALLRNALKHLAPGGRLVYSTCALEPEENEAVIAEVLAGNTTLRCGSAAPALLPYLATDADAQRLFDHEGNFRTFPPEHGTDGFFAAVLERATARG